MECEIKMAKIITKEIQNKHIGARIRHSRESIHMSREELGRRIGVTGHTIANIEYGEKSTSIKNLCEIANILGVSLDWISGRTCSEADDPDRNLIYENIIALLSVCSMQQLKYIEEIVRLYIKGVVDDE